MTRVVEVTFEHAAKLQRKEITRLRALIAAATPGPWIRHGSHFYAESDRRLLGTIEWPLLVENADLFLELVKNAAALADALEKAELLEWALANCYIAGPTAWEDGKQIDAAEIDSIDALRAAKEAADAKA